LRFAGDNDAAAIHRWRDEPSIRLHQPIARATIGQLRAELAIQRVALLRQGGGQKYQWIVVVGSEAAGWITLVIHNWDHGLAELGYALSSSFQRRGVMPIALRQFTDEIFLSTRLERLEARCSVENTASAKVLEACGFVREGRLRGYFLLGGRRVDNYLFALLRSDALSKLALPRST
jgi:RimJ/RimL family protein N-acetyltransferase